jgi:integrase
VDAFQAKALLAPHDGKTLVEAVRFYVEHLERTATSVPFSTLAARVRAEFQRRLKANEQSDRNVETLHQTLRKLEARFGSRVVSTVTADEIGEWLTNLGLAAKTRNKIRGYARQAFKFAVAWGYTTANPVTVDKFRERYNDDGKIGVLTVAETDRLFRAASPEIVPFLALWCFAGIRRSTLERLDWSDIRFDEKVAVVPRNKGKNQRKYKVTLSPNLIEWLLPYRRATGTLLALSHAPQSRGKPSKRRTRGLLQRAAASVGVTLPDNAGRNGFISYHVALHESIDTTALESDNSAAVIKKDYLDITTKDGASVTKEQASRYFGICPDTSRKVIPMTVAA